MKPKDKNRPILFAILIAVLAISCLTYSTFFTKAQSSTDPSLVGLWHFDEGSGTTASDSSGKGNNGTLINEPVWTAGKVGGALSFDGSNDYVHVPNSASLNPSSQITLAVWIKPNVITTEQYMEIMRQDSGGNIKLFSFQEYGTQLTLGLNTGGGYWETDFSITPSYFTDGNWHHVVYTYDGSYARLFIDGSLNNSQARSGSIAAETAPLIIGSAGGGGEFFNGLIDEVAIYNRALSAAEISAIYNSYKVQMEPLSFFMIKELKINWRPGEGRVKADKIKVEGKLDLPSAYTPADLDPEVTLIMEIGGTQGTDTILAKIKEKRWDYKRKKYEIPSGANLNIKKIKIQWAGKEGKLDIFKIEGDIEAENDSSGNVTLTLILPLKAGGDLFGTEKISCKTEKQSWEYNAK